MVKKYKIQIFNDPETFEQKIGLFKRATWKGEGHGMGWYGAEYYLFAKMIAFATKTYNDCVYEKKFYRKLSIYSIMTEEIIKAKSDKDAIIKFEQYLSEQRKHDKL